MNYSMIARQLGLLLMVLGVCMGAVTVAEVLGFGHDDFGHTEPVAQAFFVGLAVNLGLGGALWFFGRKRNGVHDVLGRRDAMLLVALSWIIGAATAAIPFNAWVWLSSNPEVGGHPFGDYINCYFESMSGLTTTGASILNDAPYDIESLPAGLLLWRSAIQWFGGLGIVVLFVAVLPLVGVGGKKLVQFETTGPTKQGVRPRVKETARALWLIYLGLTICCALLLCVFGMSAFDAINHTFAALATGGFSTRNASVGAYNSWGIDGTLTLFMIFAGVNFGLYYQLLSRKWSDVWGDPELRWYLGIIVVGTLVIAGYLWGTTLTLTTGQQVHADALTALRQSAFQVASIQTTTGFATADFDRWAFAPKAILVTLMFVGGCAGSTGGGIKVIRIVSVVKIVFAEVERVFRPTVVRTVRFGGAVLDDTLREAVLVFTLIMLGLFFAGAVSLRLLEPGLDFVSAATASAATLFNIGPGLHRVGPTHNFAFFSDGSKVIMSVLMALGRLEVFALLVLLTPRFWRGN